MQTIEAVREAGYALPAILSELFEQHVPRSAVSEVPDGRGVDFVVDAGERRWLVQVKNSSSPGVVAAAAERFGSTLWAGQSLPLLVVPYMTAAGSKVAEERRLNWVDLSGNAHMRDSGLIVSVRGLPNRFAARGRPASPFAPKSSRIARALLLDPSRWWRQKELAEHTDLDPGRVSRVVRSLGDDELLTRDGPLVRPRDPDLLLDAWADDYRFDRHDIVTGHLSGNGMELTRDVHEALTGADVDHAFTGLPAAWLLNRYAQFRVVSVYVTGNPRTAADRMGVRRNARGANVQLIGPDDRGVFDGRQMVDGLPCVAHVQTYLDLTHLPERAAEAAEYLRGEGRLWSA